VRVDLNPPLLMSKDSGFAFDVFTIRLQQKAPTHYSSLIALTRHFQLTTHYYKSTRVTFRLNISWNACQWSAMISRVNSRAYHNRRTHSRGTGLRLCSTPT
jgi:hypothetical protein